MTCRTIIVAVAGAGSCGDISGAAAYLKPKIKAVVIATGCITVCRLAALYAAPAVSLANSQIDHLSRQSQK